jgi:hypothetical protein
MLKLLKPRHQATEIQAVSVLVASLLLSMSTSVGAAGYTVKEIPIPDQITIPAGNSARPVCLHINEVGQVACQLEIIETLTPTPLDRFRQTPKIFASYAFRYDNATGQSVLLSPINAGQRDKANAINDFGSMAGSTDNVKLNKPQGIIWTNGLSTPQGAGEITDLNNDGLYVMNNRLIVNNSAASFPGSQVAVHAINNSAINRPVKIAGTQSFGSKLGQNGTGLLYSATPALPATTLTSLFAFPSMVTNFAVRELTDNGNFVISGIPQTISALVALNCKETFNCQVYVPLVGASKRNLPYILLDGVNDLGQAVGSDGGTPLLINPPTATAPNGTRVDLNLVSSPAVLGQFMYEATDVNNQGLIVALGIKAGAKLAAYLLTPTP